MVGRFIGSGASIALIDLREDQQTGQQAIAELSDFVEANGFGLVVIVEVADTAVLAALEGKPVTQIIASPYSEMLLGSVLNFSKLSVDRLHGQTNPDVLGRATGPAGWL